MGGNHSYFFVTFRVCALDPAVRMGYPPVRYHKRYQGKFPALLGYWFLQMGKNQAGARSRFEVEKMKILKKLIFQDLKHFLVR